MYEDARDSWISASSRWADFCCLESAKPLLGIPSTRGLVRKIVPICASYWNGSWAKNSLETSILSTQPRED